MKIDIDTVKYIMYNRATNKRTIGGDNYEI